MDTLLSVAAAGLVIVFLLAQAGAFYRRARWKRLMTKYNDESLVGKIMGRQLWEGMTQEHLKDAIGSPEAVDVKHYKTKRAETWKYQQTGTNRFNVRVYIEDGIVVGFQKKDDAY